MLARARRGIDAAALNAHLAAKFVKWWLPEDYVFITEIPRTSTGKFLKTRLREMHAGHVWPSR